MSGLSPWKQVHVRVEEVFEASDDSAVALVPDAWVMGTCEVCELETPLSTMEVRERGQQTEYHCLRCDAAVIIVGPAPGLKGGARFGEWVVKGQYKVVPPPAS